MKTLRLFFAALPSILITYTGLVDVHYLRLQVLILGLYFIVNLFVMILLGLRPLRILGLAVVLFIVEHALLALATK